MLKAVTAEQMRRIDEVTIRERGVPGIELMRNAGRAVASEVFSRFAPSSVAIVCGKGNNGGDGFIVAAELHRFGVEVRVFMLFDPAEAVGDARIAYDETPDAVPRVRIESAAGLAGELARFEVIVDAIFGTGLRDAPRGLAAEVIGAINESGVPVAAIDMPSGLFASAGQGEGACVRATMTVTIGLPKIGLLVEPGIGLSGAVTVADIGFPADLLEDESIRVGLADMADAARWLPSRSPSGNKGTFGRVLILAGSEGMTGAAILAARAAVRSGAGLVFSAYPRPLGAIMETNLIEPVKIPLEGDAAWFTPAMIDPCLARAEEADTVALGPGLGQRQGARDFVEAMIRSVRAPLVLDADALNLIADRTAILNERPGPTVLTPHPGEAARLLGRPTAEIQADRLDAFAGFSAERNVVVVLKGAQTIITSPDGFRLINPTGNSGLAKGGSGDVLTGLIAGLLAQGCDAADAARLGVFVHGLAADEVVRGASARSLTPTDVIEALPRAWRAIETGNPGQAAGGFAPDRPPHAG